MRQQLKEIAQERMRFRATVERYGTKSGWKGAEEQTILLKDIRRVDTDQVVTDHLWMTVGKTIWQLTLQSGDTVEFDARVDSYWKGYISERYEIYNQSLDYKLSRPTKMAKVKKQ